jgi:hypothetical protein
LKKPWKAAGFRSRFGGVAGTGGFVGARGSFGKGSSRFRGVWIVLETRLLSRRVGRPRRRVRGGAGKGSTVELDPSAPLLGGQTASTTSLLSSEAQN